MMEVVSVEAVALNHGEAKPRPEGFGWVIECGAAGDEGPEFPSHLAMDAAEDPPAAQEVFAFGGCELLAKFVELARTSTATTSS